MPTDLDFDTQVRLHIYHHLVGTGLAPSAAETAVALKTPRGEVESALTRLHESHMLVLHPETTDVWMANPLSAVPTAFTVEADERSWYGNCIWDSMGIAAMLGVGATVRTNCPDCDEPLSVRIESQTLVPGEGVVHFSVPARHWWDDIGYT